MIILQYKRSIIIDKTGNPRCVQYYHEVAAKVICTSLVYFNRPVRADRIGKERSRLL